MKKLKARYQAWKAYKNTVRELNRLSNHELSDIGISRGEIRRIASQM